MEGNAILALLALLAPPALAAVPSNAHFEPCPLDGLPNARVAWSAAGSIWFVDGGDVLVESEVGWGLPPDVAISCVGTTIRVTTFQNGVEFGVRSVKMDLREVLAAEVPRRSPEARTRRALAAHDLPSALDAAAGLPPSASELRLAVAREALSQADPAHAAAMVADLPPQTPGITAIQAEIARRSLFAAQALFDARDLGPARAALAPALAATSLPEWNAEDRTRAEVLRGRLLAVTGDFAGALACLEPVVAADPTQGVAWLAVADARWALKDKKGARAAYAEAARTLPTKAIPPYLAERCKGCVKK